MPFVKVSVGRKLSENEITAVCDVVSQHITTIPGKTVAATMVQLEDGRRMYKDASQQVCVFIDLRLFGKASEEAKQKLCRELIADLSVMLDVQVENIYMNITECEHWGKNGEWC